MLPSPKGFQIYASSDYRHALKGLVKAQQLTNKSLTYQSLAEATRIPKSYLSKVLSETANLNADQAYSLGKELHLDNNELKYFLLLLERDRSSLKARQEELQVEIEAIQQKHLQTQNYLSHANPTEHCVDLAPYYHTPWAQIVHIGLTVPRFATNPELLRITLKMESHEFLRTLRVLESIKLIIPGANGYETKMPRTHLTPDSPHYHPWKLQQDALVSAAFLNKQDQRHYGFNVTFSCTEKLRTEIRRKFLEFIKSVEEQSVLAPAEQVLQLRFDLFSWTPQD